MFLFLCCCQQLRLQSQLQKREALVSKKGELTAQIESLDREIKVKLIIIYCVVHALHCCYWLTMQTLVNRIGPVRRKMLSVEQEKQRAVREREESEVNSREEVDSLKAREQAVKDNNQDIMRCLGCSVAVCLIHT